MGYGRCPELLDAASAKTMSDTGAAQNCGMLPQQEYVLQRGKIQRDDQPDRVIREYTFASTPFMTAWSMDESIQSDR